MWSRLSNTKCWFCSNSWCWREKFCSLDLLFNQSVLQCLQFCRYFQVCAVCAVIWCKHVGDMEAQLYFDISEHTSNPCAPILLLVWHQLRQLGTFSCDAAHIMQAFIIHVHVVWHDRCPWFVISTCIHIPPKRHSLKTVEICDFLQTWLSMEWRNVPNLHPANVFPQL